MKMWLRSFLLLALILLAGCAHWQSRSEQPTVVLMEIDDLGPEGLVQERDAAVALYQQAPSDETRLRLAYVLSRPNPSTQDLETSRKLLDEIGPDSDNVALRDALRREIALLNELELARRRADAQQDRLDAIEADLVRNQELSTELAANRRELKRLHGRLEELQEQLEALKAIEADLAKDESVPEKTGR